MKPFSVSSSNLEQKQKIVRKVWFRGCVNGLLVTVFKTPENFTVELYNPLNKKEEVNLDLKSFSELDHSEHVVYKIRSQLQQKWTRIIPDQDMLEDCFIIGENLRFNKFQDQTNDHSGFTLGHTLNVPMFLPKPIVYERRSCIVRLTPSKSTHIIYKSRNRITE